MYTLLQLFLLHYYSLLSCDRLRRRRRRPWLGFDERKCETAWADPSFTFDVVALRVLRSILSLIATSNRRR
jgi:hypothetical protein